MRRAGRHRLLSLPLEWMVGNTRIHFLYFLHCFVCVHVCVCVLMDCGFVDHGCRHGAVAWRLGSERSHVAFANQCVVGCVCTVCAVCVIQMYRYIVREYLSW